MLFTQSHLTGMTTISVVGLDQKNAAAISNNRRTFPLHVLALSDFQAREYFAKLVIDQAV